MFVVATKSRHPFCAHQWYKLVGFKVRSGTNSSGSTALVDIQSRGRNWYGDKFTSYSDETLEEMISVSRIGGELSFFPINKISYGITSHVAYIRREPYVCCSYGIKRRTV